MWHTSVGGDAPFQAREPPAGPPKLSKTRAESTFPKNLVHFPNIAPGRSQAAEFSWTSRFQNLKLHAFILILEASHENRPRIERDILIFVK